MPKTRNIVKGITIETAVNDRKCHSNSGHTINPGDQHLAVYESGTRQNLCRKCAKDILKVAIAHLEKTQADLYEGCM